MSAPTLWPVSTSHSFDRWNPESTFASKHPTAEGMDTTHSLPVTVLLTTFEGVSCFSHH
jgi:hypothetical protein